MSKKKDMNMVASLIVTYFRPHIKKINKLINNLEKEATGTPQSKRLINKIYWENDGLEKGMDLLTLFLVKANYLGNNFKDEKADMEQAKRDLDQRLKIHLTNI